MTLPGAEWVRRRVTGWSLRPAAHGGQDLELAVWQALEQRRVHGRLVDRADARRAVLAHHLVWRHAPDPSRDAWRHQVPGEQLARELRWRVTVPIARWWIRRRGLEVGLLECQEIRWRWLLGDFHDELRWQVEALEAMRKVDVRRHAAALVDAHQVARRQILEELRAAAEARQRDRAGTVH